MSVKGSWEVFTSLKYSMRILYQPREVLTEIQEADEQRAAVHAKTTWLTIM